MASDFVKQDMFSRCASGIKRLPAEKLVRHQFLLVVVQRTPDHVKFTVLVRANIDIIKNEIVLYGEDRVPCFVDGYTPVII